MAEHHVFLIFGEFQGDLWSLSRTQHVWLMRSPGNDAAAQLVWDREPEQYTPLHGVTTFRCAGASAAEFYRMLVTVDGHHDEFSVDVPWTTIHVRGISLGEVSANRVSTEVGSTCTVLPEAEGFAIIRAAQQGAAADDRPQAGDRG